ncbi:MAG TPA: glycerol-3-phosphate dehydrogenase [Burkholderiales bacterium]|nr:glycerol-3-phosphate dehydrogenase [Burkholderiales bacterium]
MPGGAYDLLVIGGGINGAGIARDAAGRGLSVLLVEAGDLAGATSSASSKLIHGGLRYLEQYEFRLVAEALAEREVLLRVAAHLASPMRFIMPHVPELRPRWMIRLGLFLYDHLARRSLLPGSQPVRLDASPYRHNLRPELRHGFAFSDCRVDDARLVIANAADAAARGARIRVRTQCVSARRSAGGWQAELSGGERVSARAIANAAGPWVKRVLNERLGQPSADAVRLVRGSHILVPRLYPGEHAFILQNEDRRVIFMIPFEERFTLIGTTDVPAEGEPAPLQPAEEEVDYLCRAVSRYLAEPLRPAQVVWRYAGVRPLYDDGSRNPSAVTRDYTLRVDDDAGEAPVLSVFGGKITTYRRLAEQAMDRLARYFPRARRAWTATAPLPGSSFTDRAAAFAALSARYSKLPEEVLRGVFRRHGSAGSEVLGDGQLGEYYGAGLTEREVRYFIEHEWARSAEDVLWRRSKAGLHLTEREQARIRTAVGA